MNLIPLPSNIAARPGKFSIGHDTAIVLDVEQDDIDFETAKLLQKEVGRIIAITLPIKKGWKSDCNENNNCICFQYDKSNHKPEAYRLVVTENKIAIFANTHRGFLYAASTLIQLCKISNGEIDCVEIIDAPSYINRGYLLDVSRGRVPTMDSLKALVDKLALYKINQLQLYVENSFRLEGFQEIWSQTDPFTPEEILELDYHCNMRGIELVPCIATFGHLYNLLRSESFAQYREVEPRPDEIFTWYNRMIYHTINVTDPGSLKLITGILDQYTALFRSNKVNICCDETFELGKGKSAGHAEKMTEGELYLSYVNKLVTYLQKEGKEVMIWGDVLQNNQEMISELNPEVTCLNWHYEYGVNEEIVQIYAEHGLNQYVCPSVSGYSRLVNAYDLSFSNIKEMSELGKKYDADGFLNTDWGDSGNINMPSLAIPCMIYGAAKGWNVEDNRPFEEIDKTISMIEFDDREKTLVGLLRDLSHQDLITFNDFVFFRDYKVLNQTYDSLGGFMHEKSKKNIMEIQEKELKEAVANCAKIIKTLKKNDSTSHTRSRHALVEYYLAARGVALMQELALVIKKYEYGQDVSPMITPDELAGKLEYWLMDYCAAWRVVSRESELFRIKEFIWQICTILRRYHRMD
jgi:hypothetical protein